MNVRFTVLGKAAPAGSKRAFVVAGRARVTDANKNAAPWKALVAAAAVEAYDGPLLDGPLVLTITEIRVRPKGHFTGSGQLSKKGRETPFPTSKPDCLKIARGIEDALSGVVYRDDALIVEEHLRKRWGPREHTVVEIETRTESWKTMWKEGAR